MNQRIQEIAKACGVYIAYDNRRVTDAELQFFAEQIVRECAEVIDNHYEPVYDGKLIKQYFGVE